MKVIHATAELNTGGRPVCAAIGVFDGVHLGHQRVLEQTSSDATKSGGVAVAVTFDRHPNAVVAPAHVPPLIYPLAKKIQVLGSLGLDVAFVIPFDKAFSQLSGEQFVRNLARDSGKLQSVCVGANFMFGACRSGDVALLEKLGGEYGFAVHALADVGFGGEGVSSTRIRDAVRAGDFALAGEMLGRAYSLCGRVVPGRQLGRKLGFPTANMDVAGIIVPPTGVYAAEAKVGAGRWRAAVNIGNRPTIQGGDLDTHVEAHLLDFDGDIRGQDMELVFQKKLRDEKKFPALEALRAQIAQDIARVRKDF